jgi:N-acetyl-1-D-myo-inositol-2-amino-2-deoxy-alpha-D-glucopyranoside deacetylase
METVLAIVPHPDDEAYSFAGTLAMFARRQEGWRVFLVCASWGERGPGVRAHGEAGLAASREAELRESCRAIGATLDGCWGLPDRRVTEQGSQAHRVGALLAQYAPSVVFTLGPDGAYGNRDHIAVHESVVEAWTASAEPRPVLLVAAFPRDLMRRQADVSHRVVDPDIVRRGLGVSEPHYRVSLPADAVEAKRGAMSAHKSQLRGRGIQNLLVGKGVIEWCLRQEWFLDARGASDLETARLLDRVVHGR